MIPLLLWDASVLAKRYAPESGSDTVHFLFHRVPAFGMVTTFLGYAETYSVLLRKHHRGDISPATRTAAKTLLRSEIINDARFTLLAVDEYSILDGLPLMEAYHLNASDAAILATYRGYLHDLEPLESTAFLVATDQRLLKAAEAEGIQTVNPEMLSVAEAALRLEGL